MSTATAAPRGGEQSRACRHCGLPVRTGRRGPQGPLFCCLGCRLACSVSRESGESGQTQWTLVKLGLGVFFSMNAMVFTLALWSQHAGASDAAAEAALLHDVLRWLALLLTAPVLVLLGGPLLEGAWESVAERRLSTDVLLLLGVAAAFASSLAATLRGQGHVYFDVVCGVLVAVTLGRWLEANGKQRTTAALRSLHKLLPETVRRVDSGGESEVSVAALRAGDVYRVVAGQRIATDGRLAGGRALVDQQMLTGESAAVELSAGDPVLGGVLNLQGDVLIEAVEAGGGGALQRLVEAVEQAARQRPQIQRIADRLAAWLTPLVVLLAAAAAALHWQRGPAPALMTALSVVLIACPCALAVATPLAFWAALGAAARSQVLLRNGDAVARLASVRHVFLDKTGTLTCGETVQRMHASPPHSESEVLQVAARLAASSTHPASAAVLAEAAGAPAALPAARERRGRGVVATLDGAAAALGSRRLMDELQLPWPEPLSAAYRDAVERGRTVVAVGFGGSVRGVLELGEQWRAGARDAIAELRRAGLSVSVLTGDHLRRAEVVRQELGVEVRGELTAEDKLEAIRRCDAPSAMVGDGVNDAPALAAAMAGVALESAADVSRDNADVCLLGGQLRRLPWAVELSRRTMRTVRRNLFWSLAYNAGGLALAMTGRLHPAAAAAAMVLSSLWVIGSSLQLSREAFSDGQPQHENENGLRPHGGQSAGDLSGQAPASFPSQAAVQGGAR